MSAFPPPYIHLTNPLPPASSHDHSRDLIHLVNHFRDEMPRPIMGIGHSLGCEQLYALPTPPPTPLTPPLASLPPSSTPVSSPRSSLSNRT